MRKALVSGTYSERLFGGGIYGAHHAGRFGWLTKKLASARPRSVLELGCYDGRAIGCIPEGFERYVGVDAGWESGLVGGRPVGLDAAIAQHGADPRMRFLRSTRAEDLLALEGTFDAGVSLETLEHVDPATVPAYVDALARKIHGTLFVSVPNEKGLPLVVKTVGERVLGVGRNITWHEGELLNAILGRMDRVERNDHKGFDWEALVAQIGEAFEDVSVEGVGVGLGFPSASLTVGIVARRSRRVARARG